MILFFLFLYEIQAQVSSLNLEKQKLSFELDKHKKMENIYKNMTGKCYYYYFFL